MADFRPFFPPIFLTSSRKIKRYWLTNLVTNIVKKRTEQDYFSSRGKHPFERNVWHPYLYTSTAHVQVLEKNVMLETILRAHFEGVLIGIYTLAILEVFGGFHCSMIFPAQKNLLDLLRGKSSWSKELSKHPSHQGNWLAPFRSIGKMNSSPSLV